MNHDTNLLSADHPYIRGQRMKNLSLASEYTKAKNRLFWGGFTWGIIAAFVVFCIAAFFWGGF